MKIGLSLSDELVARIDEYRSTKGLTRSGAVSAICLDYFDALALADSQMKKTNSFAVALAKFSSGEISRDEFEMICKGIMV